jgi:hypothetical protein
MKNQRRKNIQLGKKHFLFACVVILLGLILSLSFVWLPAASAQEGLPFIWQVQVMQSDQTGLSNPVGLAFSSRANAFQVAEGKGPSETTDLVKLTPFADRAGEARIAAAMRNPINIAYDDQVGRLLILRGNGNQLWEVREGLDGNLDPQTLTRHDVRDLNLQDPQGMTVDANGTLLILDAVGPRIVRVQPGAAGDLESATISEVSLGLASPRGIAFDATTGNLHVMVPGEQKLYELTQSGEVLNVRDLAQFSLKNPQGMVFAPSGDQTDDASQLSLFVADGADSQSTGQIMELSLMVPEALPSGTTLVPTTLVHTIDTSKTAWNPSAPDTSGIDYWPLTGRLLISDSEVDEMPKYFTGNNVFDSTLSGTLVSTCSTTNLQRTGFSNEPTGLAINRDNNRIYFTDDDANKIHEVNLSDNTYCNSNDVVTTVNVGTVYNIQDAEDVAFGFNALGKSTLFIAGGNDAEVYIIPLGANGVLGGGDDGPMTHFDTASLGFHILEGIGYNWDNGTLLLASATTGEKYIGEVTTTGTLQRAYDLAYLSITHREDVTLAPGSQNAALTDLYISDRGVDNNTNSSENDGKVWEVKFSSSGTPTPTPTFTPTRTPTPGPSPTNTPTPAVSDLIFADGFESRDLSAWSASTTNGGNLSVSTNAALVESYGLQATINNTNAMLVRDDSPNAEPRYRARFYFDPNSITMVNGDTHIFFQGNMGTSTGVVRGQFRFSSGQYQVRFNLLNDSGTWQNTSWFTISDAPHSIEIDWAAATTAGANNGFLTLWIDGNQQPSLTGIDNDTKRIDRAMLGPRSGLDTGTQGAYYFDAFESRRQTYIGP